MHELLDLTIAETSTPRPVVNHGRVQVLADREGGPTDPASVDDVPEDGVDKVA